MAQREPSPDRVPDDGAPHGQGAEELANEFMQHRPRLLGVAYRLLGTMWDAEDIVADAMVRWLSVEREQIRGSRGLPDHDGDAPSAGPAAVGSRGSRALHGGVAARADRHGAVAAGPVGHGGTTRVGVVGDAADDGAVDAPERAVFVLHEAFAVPHAEIADVLDITPANSRQHLHRARSHLEGADRRLDVEDPAHDTLFERFLGALEDGDLDRVRDLLADDVVAYSDGGGKARAARRPVAGPAEVIVYFGALRRHHSIRVERRVEVNGASAALLWFGRQYQLLAVDVRAGYVREIHSIMNPDKLEYLSRQLAAQ